MHEIRRKKQSKMPQREEIQLAIVDFRQCLKSTIVIQFASQKSASSWTLLREHNLLSSSKTDTPPPLADNSQTPNHLDFIPEMVVVKQNGTAICNCRLGQTENGVNRVEMRSVADRELPVPFQPENGVVGRCYFPKGVFSTKNSPSPANKKHHAILQSKSRVSFNPLMLKIQIPRRVS